jgi:RNA polymerase sigma-70 factor (ECF subfamily)
MAESAPAVEEDPVLVRRACSGDREAFYKLVSRYERGLFRSAVAITRNPADAEEVVQETFLRAYEHLNQFRAEAKFQTWLTQIALNTARMKLRKAHAGLWESLDAPRQTEDGLLPRDVTEWRENPEQRLRREEIEQLLHQALQGLPPGYREVVALRDIQMLSTQETADVLGISVANVKTRLLRARLQLRERLAKPLGRQA